jgi:hypothetical protein
MKSRKIESVGMYWTKADVPMGNLPYTGILHCTYQISSHFSLANVVYSENLSPQPNVAFCNMLIS